METFPGEVGASFIEYVSAASDFSCYLGCRYYF